MIVQNLADDQLAEESEDLDYLLWVATDRLRIPTERLTRSRQWF